MGRRKKAMGWGREGTQLVLLPSSPPAENAPGASVAQAGHL